MIRVFYVSLSLFLLTCVTTGDVWAQDDNFVPLGVQSSGRKVDMKKLKEAIQNNNNFGRMNRMKPYKNPYAGNYNGMTSDKFTRNAAKIRTDFNYKPPKNKYQNINIMPQPKGLKNIDCLGTPNKGDC